MIIFEKDYQSKLILFIFRKHVHNEFFVEIKVICSINVFDNTKSLEFIYVLVKFKKTRSNQTRHKFVI